MSTYIKLEYHGKGWANKCQCVSLLFIFFMSKSPDKTNTITTQKECFAEGKQSVAMFVYMLQPPITVSSIISSLVIKESVSLFTRLFHSNRMFCSNHLHWIIFFLFASAKQFATINNAIKSAHKKRWHFHHQVKTLNKLDVWGTGNLSVLDYYF